MKYSQFFPENIFFTLRFFLPAFLTLILAKTLFELLAFNYLDFNQILIQKTFLPLDSKGQIATQLNEFKARLMWATSAMVYFFIIAGFGGVLWNILKKASTKSVLLFIVIASTITAVETGYLLSVDASASPIASIFSFTFSALSDSARYTATQLLIIHSTLDAINLLSFLVTPFGILAVCCIMHEIPLTLHKDAKYYLGRSELLKKVITGGSAVMVIGIIHMQLWLNWPLSFVGESKEIVQLKSVTLLICQYWGASYSLIIAAVYLPAASYLSDQATQTLLQGNDETLKHNPSKWLNENNMALSPINSLPQILAVLAPLLAGSFGSSLSELVFY